MTSGAALPRVAPGLKRNRDYLLWLTGFTLSALGSGIQSASWPLIGLRITGSVQHASIITSALMLGQLVGTPAGGVLADRLPKRTLLLVSSLVDSALFLALAGLICSPHGPFTVVVLGAGLSGATAAMSAPAKWVSLQGLVAPADLPTAISVNEGRSAVIELTSGPLGGLLVAIWPTLPLLVNSISYLAEFVTVARITPLRLGYNERTDMSWLRDAWQGFEVLVRTRSLLVTAVVSALINLGFSGLSLSLVFALRARGVPYTGIGFMETAMGAGLLLGAVLAPRLVPRAPSGGLLIAGLLAVPAASAGLLASQNFWLVLGCVFLATLPAPLIGAVTGTFQMLCCPTQHMGKLNAATSVLSMLLLPAAPLAVAWLYNRGGIRPCLWACIGLSLASPALVAATRRLRTADFRHVQEPTTVQPTP